jgi:hypothetical protein
LPPLDHFQTRGRFTAHRKKDAQGMARHKKVRNNWLIGSFALAAVAVGGGATPARADEVAIEQQEPSQPTWPAFRESPDEPSRPTGALGADFDRTQQQPPVLAAPLPPAVISGGALLAVNFALAKLRGRRLG